jgi:hypothetical protein
MRRQNERAGLERRNTGRERKIENGKYEKQIKKYKYTKK